MSNLLVMFFLLAYVNVVAGAFTPNEVANALMESLDQCPALQFEDGVPHSVRYQQVVDHRINTFFRDIFFFFFAQNDRCVPLRQRAHHREQDLVLERNVNGRAVQRDIQTDRASPAC